MVPWAARAQEDSLKRIHGIDTLDAHLEPFSRRHDRRKPRGRLRADELVPDGDGAAGVPEIAWLLGRGYLDGVIGELKSGKEATVYLGRTRVGLAAVKVYRDLTVRSFKNDARYRAGRYIGDARVEKAIARGSAFGRRAQGRLWAAHEYAMLWRLWAAGVPVPEPLVGPDEAGPAFEQAVRAMTAMWREGIVHGDYSAYNLLWWRGRVVVIDLPQAVDAGHGEARELLARDAASLCRTFRAHGIEVAPERVLRAVVQG